MQDYGIWNNETVLNFIEEYRKRPVLWKDTKTKHSEAEKTALKKVAWEDIANVTGINGDELKRKWGTIMSVYRKELHKVDRRSGPNEPFTPRWYCFDKLSFLPLPKKNPQKMPSGRRFRPDKSAALKQEELICEETEDIQEEESEFQMNADSLYQEEGTAMNYCYPGQRDECDAFGGKMSSAYIVYKD